MKMETATATGELLVSKVDEAAAVDLFRLVGGGGSSGRLAGADDGELYGVSGCAGRYIAVDGSVAFVGGGGCRG